MAYYDSISKGYDSLHQKEQLRKLVIIKNYYSLQKKDKLLDVGCGTGIAKKIFGCRYVGVDPSEGMISKFKGKKIIAIAEKLPFKDKMFDLVISVTSIHNFQDYKKALKEMLRVGKGKFAISIFKKSRKFKNIKSSIEKIFKVEQIINESIDMIYFLAKKED